MCCSMLFRTWMDGWVDGRMDGWRITMSVMSQKLRNSPWYPPGRYGPSVALEPGAHRSDHDWVQAPGRRWSYLSCSVAQLFQCFCIGLRIVFQELGKAAVWIGAAASLRRFGCAPSAWTWITLTSRKDRMSARVSASSPRKKNVKAGPSCWSWSCKTELLDVLRRQESPRCFDQLSCQMAGVLATSHIFRYL